MLITPCVDGGGAPPETRSGPGISAEQADATVIGFEMSAGFKKSLVGRFINRFINIENLPIPTSGAIGAEFVRHNKSGESDIFITQASAFGGNTAGTGLKEIGMGKYGTVYLGGVHNLDKLGDYATSIEESVENASFNSPENALSTIFGSQKKYTRYEGTVSFGLGATVRHSSGLDNSVQINSFGITAGTSFQATRQDVRVVSVTNLVEYISYRAGSALGSRMGVGERVVPQFENLQRHMR